MPRSQQSFVSVSILGCGEIVFILVLSRPKCIILNTLVIRASHTTLPNTYLHFYFLQVHLSDLVIQTVLEHTGTVLLLLDLLLQEHNLKHRIWYHTNTLNHSQRDYTVV